MQDERQRQDLLNAIEELGPFQAPRRVEHSDLDGAVAIEGEVCVEGREATLRLVLGPSFPLELPRFYLLPWDTLGFIPHVMEENGFVCFADPEGLLVDRRRPVDVVQEAFGRALRVLADGVSGRNHADFVDEFEAYWSRLPQGIVAAAVLAPSDSLARVIVAVGRDNRLWIAGREGDISAFRNGAHVGGEYTLQNALYLPLEPGASVIPPHADRPFWTAQETRDALLPGLSEANRARLRKLTKKRTRGREYVIVRLPRPSGGESFFGIRYDVVGDKHPLLEGGTAERLVPIQMSRWDRAYLIGRGGGDTALGSKRVLLVGCGAVGGHLAIELAHAGVLDLTLVDPEKLSPDNTFRHALGRQYWGEPKAEALKKEIEGQLPYIRVRAHVKTIQRALADNSVNLEGYDLVVLALGNPTVELAINERLRRLPDGPAALFTWLEPLGIGGHALLTGNGDDAGCCECLYTSPDGLEEALFNRASFAAPGQSFGRALSGCGTLHTPYASVDAVRTTALAVRLALDSLTGSENGNPLLSWKGNPSAFEAAGFRLSGRYGVGDDELYRQRYAYQSRRCRICGTHDGADG